MTTTVAVLNQKGGSGKSTLATNLAQVLHLAGKKTLLIDTDRQASARQWAAGRAEGLNGVPVVGVDIPPIDKGITAVSGGFDWVIIDGAPNVETLAASAVKVADIVLIPVQPSPYDIWAANEL